MCFFVHSSWLARARHASHQSAWLTSKAQGVCCLALYLIYSFDKSLCAHRLDDSSLDVNSTGQYWTHKDLDPGPADLQVATSDIDVSLCGLVNGQSKKDCFKKGRAAGGLLEQVVWRLLVRCCAFLVVFSINEVTV